MIRVGWLVDEPVTITVGGAELTQAEFRVAAPDNVEIVDCPPGSVEPGLDVYAIHNSVTYLAEDLESIKRAPAVKYWNDVGSWVHPEALAILAKHSTPVCISPLQAEYMALKDARLIPPPVNLEWFEQAAANMNGSRKGSVCVGSWRNYGKAPHRAAEWGAENGGVDFYGDGPFAPQGSHLVAYENMPALLARYRTFVFLPSVIEPFGRVVAEAWAAGCELVVNNLVGASYWLTEDPDAIRTAAEDFWKLVLA